MSQRPSMVVSCMWVDRAARLIFKCQVHLVSTIQRDDTADQLAIVLKYDCVFVSVKHVNVDAIKVVAVLLKHKRVRPFDDDCIRGEVRSCFS